MTSLIEMALLFNGQVAKLRKIESVVREMFQNYPYLGLHVCFSHAVKLEDRWCGELV
jgi:hypothetical protein